MDVTARWRAMLLHGRGLPPMFGSVTMQTRRECRGETKHRGIGVFVLGPVGRKYTGRKFDIGLTASVNKVTIEGCRSTRHRIISKLFDN